MKVANLFLLITVGLVVVMICMACGDDNNDSNNHLTYLECADINDHCRNYSEDARDEYQCEYSEPDTPACQIETEGYYNRTYYDCMKNKVGKECENLMLSEKQCLAKCYYSLLNGNDYEAAIDECTTKCVKNY